jgi:hypothetical protein
MARGKQIADRRQSAFDCVRAAAARCGLGDEVESQPTMR